ncbi:MAG TPA: serine/threonine-protein kinase, partial [Polyangiaceae bacterium]|nr:serine/threonine-protein kinase [Polyangiaceae bacterium]
MTTGGAPAVSRLPESIWREEALARRFRVERELGRGGQAVVVVAYHRELDERVALKFLLPDVAQSSASIARFRREARAAAKIKNEHVVRIIDVCATESGIPYIVMEYLDGHDLEHLLRRAPKGQLAVPDAVDFVLQASEALAEGHRLGIVHRDLKPANLFCVDRDDGFPMIKVLDFGISKIQPLPGDVERTDRYEILGSPRYMSPEQIDASRDVDQRSDIWSLGVILYQAIAGRVPFGGEIVADLWHKIRTATPLPLIELREIPEALNRAVMRCLEKEPARRFANLGEFADALACVAPEQSRNSIDRILRATGTRPAALHSSIPTVTTDPTLVAGSVPTVTHNHRRRTTVVGLCVAVSALAGLTATRFILRQTPDTD